ncbi:MAG: alpha/beta hydrolase [Ignavibacteria bacterium]|nr:alpha/beta hydrolase [Ignavibacteria bacterium]MBT8382985.1 alpha/beta hydrolase [Ignavibacteria bacterium]MBT8391426.1 alpha/beta hydrolase [Ignavibacteria bacterium]NNJ54367.1 alpha/beta hydrolase [Ignavibacteriaceae bacterium]NNL21999.1 alpha/beta hydrolase [Ignavibacteriaceae bacterium]
MLFFKRRRKFLRKKRTDSEAVIGNVQYHRESYSHNLESKRDFFVWLPPGYNNSKDRQYPVLYMHDGQNLIDPKTAYAGKDWQVDETLTRLISEYKMKEIIVVGIYNSDDRLEEYSDSEKGKKYLKFLVEELKSFVDSNYRTLSDKQHTAIIGSSMGGLISFLAAWKHTEVFGMAGCMSSSFYYNDEKIFKTIDEYEGEKKHIKFYIDHGEDGLLRGQKMFCKLTQLGYIIGTDIDYFYAPGAEHNESEWAKRLERPLLYFFGN